MIVRTTAGEVRGEPIATGVRFRGIPYAAAPEGGLRFAEPAPPPPGTASASQDPRHRNGSGRSRASTCRPWSAPAGGPAPST
jgi:hypothetical protein